MASPVMVEVQDDERTVIASIAPADGHFYPFRTKEEIATFFGQAPAMYEELEKLVAQDSALVTLERTQSIKKILARARGERAA